MKMKIKIKYIFSIVLLIVVTAAVLELPRIYYYFSDSYRQDIYNSEEISLSDGREDITPEKCLHLLSSSNATKIEVTPSDGTEIQIDTILKAIYDLNDFAVSNGYSYFSELLNNIIGKFKNFSINSAKLLSISGAVDDEPVSLMIWVVLLYSGTDFCYIILDDSTNMIYSVYVCYPFDRISGDVEITDEIIKETLSDTTAEIQNAMSNYWNMSVSDDSVLLFLDELYINPDIYNIYEKDIVYGEQEDIIE